MLEGAQRMLLRLGIASSLYKRAQFELVITGENVAGSPRSSASPTTNKRARLARLLGSLQAHAESRAFRRDRGER